MAKSSRKPGSRKPYPDFPLTRHRNGQWCKKIRGKIYYFGTDADKALELYRLQCDDLFAGRTPRQSPDDLTVEDVCNLFLESKKQLVASRRLSQRTWDSYRHVCQRAGRVLGNLIAASVAPADFDRLYTDIAGTCKTLKAIDSTVNMCRLPFSWAYKEARLLEHPLHFGPLLKRVSRREMRRDRALRRHENGKMMFEPEEVRAILAAAPVHIRTMVWLGINCGFGNADVGSLMEQDLDLDGRWVHLPRSKSGEERRCPLWPQTAYAIKQSVANRPTAADRQHDSLVFLTQRGNPWHSDRPGIRCPLSHAFGKLLDALGLRRGGRNFYALRHTFQTIAEDGTRDVPAVRSIMGHIDPTMAAEYREQIADDRLYACTDAVGDWLMTARDVEELRTPPEGDTTDNAPHS